jgi:hypothetical protein
MSTQPLHENVRALSAQTLSRRSALEPRRPENCAPSTESQDLLALEVALELIEMRYQEHCARLNLEVLFAEGEMGCL